MMNRFLYPIVYSVFYCISLLPWCVIYALADVVWVLVYLVVGYRRKVVRKNLSLSFPEKTEEERRQIERRFYRWLCDYFLETVKLLSMSREDMLRHIEFRGAEEMEKCFDEGQACAAILGHYCNWEYLSATALAWKRHTEAVAGLIYHPLYNKIFDRLFIDMRSQMGGTCIPKKDILRYLLTYKREGRMSLFGYIADQSPKWENIHLWLNFMNQDTPVFTGGERIMRKMNNAVFYVDMQRPRRGKYICTFQLITRDPNALEEFGITKRFFELLEQTIRRQPEFYLWTHNRWKRTHEEFDHLFKVENGRIVLRSANNTPSQP